MNTYSKTSLFFVAILCFVTPIKAQDLKHLLQIGHYRFRTGIEDVDGNLDSVEVDNAPIVLGVGIYSNGIFPGADPKNGANIRTPELSTLYDDEFAVELEFTITELDGETRPVVVLGQNDQYLGFEVRSNNTYAFIYNKTQRLPVPGVTADLNTHSLAIIHNTVSDSTEFYFGGSLIGVLEVQLNREDDDGRITNVNNAIAQSYRGYWSNLWIYGTEDITAVRDHILKNSLSISPNPAAESINIIAEDKRIKNWSIHNASGQRLLSGNYQQDLQIDIHFLESGCYFLQLLDAEGRTMVSKQFVRM